MSLLPYNFCTIVLIVVGAFNNSSAMPADQDFKKIIDTSQDEVKDIADCRSTDSVHKLAEVLSGHQTILSHLLSRAVHQPPPQCQTVNREVAIQFEEYKNKFEAAEQEKKQLKKRLLQVETTFSQTKDTSESNKIKLEALKKKLDQAISKNLCRSPFYKVGDDCIYVDRTVQLSWHNCRNFCGSFGGDLAVPSDVLKLRKFLTSFNKGWNYWIGGSDLKREGDWLWLDGRQMDLSVGWQKGDPNNYGGNEDCVHYDAGKILILLDARCTLEYHCVCQDASYPK